MERKKKVLVMGVIGADVHAVGNRILYQAFTEAGFDVINPVSYTHLDHALTGVVNLLALLGAFAAQVRSQVFPAQEEPQNPFTGGCNGKCVFHPQCSLQKGNETDLSQRLSLIHI